MVELEDPLIGRARESHALRSLLDREDVSLVSVTGPGGIGKTRLALHVAEQARSRFEHGVAVVLLAAVREAEFVASGIAKALGLQGQGRAPVLQQIKDFVRERRLLLVLDNFEQVASAAPLVAELLRDAPGLKIVVTSRMRLHISGEHEYALEALQLPETPMLDVRAAHSVPAIALFVRRAQAVLSQFTLDARNVQAVAAICVRLEGWPLAIELAASRVKLIPPEQLLRRLQQRLPLLSGGPVDHPRRHRALRDTLDWSHELLDAAERDLFAQLSVFSGGATMEAIEAVCGDRPPGVLDALGTLVDHSLVQQASGRFAMLETIREYAAEKLQAGDAAGCRLRHAHYFLGLAEAADPLLRGASQKAWFDRLATELDNVRDALRWCVQAGQPDVGLRIGAALGTFWISRGLAAEGQRWIAPALGADGAVSAHHRAKALGTIASLARRLGDVASAREAVESALALQDALGDRSQGAEALRELGWIVENSGDNEAARAAFEESLALARATGNVHGEGAALMCLGSLMVDQGSLEAARGTLERALATLRTAGDVRLCCATLNNLGQLAQRQGRFAEARALTAESLALTQDLGDRASCALYLCNLADISIDMGDLVRACAEFKAGIEEAFAIGEARTIMGALDDIAALCIRGGQASTAAKLLAAATAGRQRIGLARAASNVEKVERHLAELKEALGPDRFDDAMAEGKVMTLPQALALVRAIDLEAWPPQAGIADAPGAVALTPRERDVLRLVAEGMTDRQIAGRLRISPATVSKHVANLLAKTTRHNRLALTLWARDLGLVDEGRSSGA